MKIAKKRFGAGPLVAVVLLTITAAAHASPPAQPSSGPGSDTYPHASYKKSSYGSGDLKYWIYEPQSPAPTSAPVLLYLHGWAADKPDIYENMLVHFARKGITVVYPKFGGLFNFGSYEANAKSAYVAALDRLQNGTHVSPDLSRTAFAAHSLGAHIALRMANSAATETYPAPLGLVLHEAAGFDTAANASLSLDDLSSIGAHTHLVLITQESWESDPNNVGTVTRAWNNTTQIPSQQKNLIAVQSDSYGNPDLVSDHLGVQSGNCGWFCTRPLDAIDWWGYWRPTEALVNHMFYGTDAGYVLGDGPSVRDMGQWSDGTQVTPKLTASDFNGI